MLKLRIGSNKKTALIEEDFKKVVKNKYNDFLKIVENTFANEKVFNINNHAPSFGSNSAWMS